MRIGIVEDEKEMREELAEYINNIIMGQEETCQVILMEKWEDLVIEKPIDILLLDYELDGKNGMEIAKEYRQKNPEVCIIFVTSHDEYACDGYEVQAFRYLLKPVDKLKLTRAMQEAFALKKDISILLQTHVGEIQIPQKDIIYIEPNSHGKGTCVRTVTGLIEEKRSLAKLEQLLDSTQFVKSHKSFLVNVSYIKEIIGREIHFTNGEMAEISVRQKKEVERAWFKYQWGQGSY